MELIAYSAAEKLISSRSRRFFFLFKIDREPKIFYLILIFIFVVISYFNLYNFGIVDDSCAELAYRSVPK